MLGALLTTGMVYLLAGRDSTVSTLILAGVAINALAAAGLSLLLNLAPSPFAVSELVLWTLGDITDRSLRDVWVMLPCTLLGWAMLAGTGHSLDALTLGERTARSMGINMRRLSWRLFIAVSLCVGAAVATTGMIGFIGLVIPHLLRPFARYQPSRLLPLAALGGAVMLLAADIGVRLIALYTSLSNSVEGRRSHSPGGRTLFSGVDTEKPQELLAMKHMSMHNAIDKDGTGITCKRSGTCHTARWSFYRRQAFVQCQRW